MWVDILGTSWNISYFQTVIADLNLSPAPQTEFEIGCIVFSFVNFVM
jgi:hypothetical protein